MPRRRAEEPQFSTDSFLDVVCNLVGIMIILIIVAGVRVTRAPMILAEDEAAPEAPAGSESFESPQPVPAGIKLTDLGGWLEEAPAAPEEPPEPEEPPADLVAQAQALKELVARLTDQQAGIKARESAARQSRESTDQQLRELSTRVKADTSQHEEQASNANEVAAKIRELEAKVTTLKTESEELAEQPAPAQILKHNVTPISRQVAEQDEVHFRLAGNRISVVPMEALAEALKTRMQRSGDLFIRLDRYEGTAGPVEGYVMNYVIENTSWRCGRTR
jgi:hypothetical protein